MLHVPDQEAIQRQFREMLRAAHPDHGGVHDDAAGRIADLTEARRILLAGMTRGEPKAGALLLFPGRGQRGAATRSLVAIEEAVAPLPTARADFPYRREGRQGPRPGAEAPRLRGRGGGGAGRRAAVAPKAIVLGGRSMGGRICSMAVADGPARRRPRPRLSYPLHPPGKPERLRIEHLPQLRVPCLFVSGTRDAVRHARRARGPHRRHPRAGRARVDRGQGATTSRAPTQRDRRRRQRVGGPPGDAPAAPDRDGSSGLSSSSSRCAVSG